MNYFYISGLLYNTTPLAVERVYRSLFAKLEQHDSPQSYDFRFQNDEVDLNLYTADREGAEWTQDIDFEGDLEACQRFTERLTAALKKAEVSYRISYTEMDSDDNEVSDEVVLKS